MTGRIRLTYAFDAYCGWCYGLGPALRELADGNADRIDLRVLSGGLFSGPRALPVGAYPHIPAASRRIAAGHGLDANAVAEAFLDPATRAEAEGGFRELRRLGVDAYPTLILHTPTGVHRFGGPISSALQLTEALDRHTAPVSA
ncbi:hypothetical protein [Nonomuraea angiospora]